MKTSSSTMALSPALQQFILHWGEMGTRWGINRTVAQIHALLYISHEPLNAEQIANTLQVARSNVSTSLRELQGWGIIKIVHKLGDRRDYYQSMDDVWEMFRVIFDERKKREADPTVEMLRQCTEEIEKEKSTDPYSEKRLKELLDFFEATTGCYEQIQKIPTPVLVKLCRMGDRIQRVVSLVSEKP